jgi:hypothetical protein
MKKTFLLLTILFSSIAVFADGGNVKSEVLQSFKRDFSGAENAVWTHLKASSRVDFTYYGSRIFIIYDSRGKITLLSRHISSLQLPFYLKKGLRKYQHSYWITDLTEISNREGYHYYLHLQNAQKKIILVSGNGSDWKIIKSQKL